MISVLLLYLGINYRNYPLLFRIILLFLYFRANFFIDRIFIFHVRFPQFLFYLFLIILVFNINFVFFFRRDFVRLQRWAISGVWFYLLVKLVMHKMCAVPKNYVFNNPRLNKIITSLITRSSIGVISKMCIKYIFNDYHYHYLYYFYNYYKMASRLLNTKSN